jgi:DNA-binding beta-propeller fold protein YncE
VRLIGGQTLRFELVKNWERLPDCWSHFDVPSVCTDPDDNVYLYCRGNQPIMVFDRDGRALDYWKVANFGVRAHCAFMSATGELFLVDEGQHSVGRFTTAGARLQQIGPSGVPSPTGYDGENYRTTTTGAGPYNRPTGLSIGPDDHIYIADGYGNCQVHRFNEAGDLLLSWGAPGSGPGEFYVPHAVAVDPDGRVLIADRENERIQIFSAGGRVLETWTDVQRPQGIFIDAAELVYVAEGAWPVGWESRRPGGGVFSKRVPGRISIYDLDGNVLARWEQPDPNEGGFLLSPHGIWSDTEGSIYVGTNVGTVGAILGQEGGECVLKFARL